ncbi:unnamed protein product [Heligmosomoides polygyrus]|uniref:Secreted protein n=1 Tax=Heligmosomoides polygyrus TaxID=6339 RepID=A0A183GDZ1_HELPZ|nr:unnamed protein product [Heligmosomoides polygyrus]
MRFYGVVLCLFSERFGGFVTQRLFRDPSRPSAKSEEFAECSLFPFAIRHIATPVCERATSFSRTWRRASWRVCVPVTLAGVVSSKSSTPDHRSV